MKYILPIVAWTFLLCVMLPFWSIGFVARWAWIWTGAGSEHAARAVVGISRSRWLEGKS